MQRWAAIQDTKLRAEMGSMRRSAGTAFLYQNHPICGYKSVLAPPRGYSHGRIVLHS